MTDDEPIIIVDDAGTEHEFPAGFDPQRAAAIVRGQSPSSQPSTKSALSMATAKPGISVAANLSARMATSPTLPKTAATIGRIIGGVAPPIGGAMVGGVPGFLAGIGAAAHGSWAGGKTGWHSGKLMQSVATPVARGLSAAAPYAQSLGTLAGAQGPLDLAQMAEPNRRDIGFLGMGASQPPLEGEPSPLLNDIAAKIRGAIMARLQRR